MTSQARVTRASLVPAIQLSWPPEAGEKTEEGLTKLTQA